MSVQEILEQIKSAYQTILREKLTGIYVHGSIAFGCFVWERSDIDFLVVVNSPLTQLEKEGLISELLSLEEQAPPKGFEMSVILADVCNPFVYPTPYELHFSNFYLQSFKDDLTAQCRSLNGTDRDLAAHITVTRAVGFPLCGPAIYKVFAAVPREHYIDSLIYDIGNAAEDIFHDPIYFMLNLCRVLAYLDDNAVLSKKQGGEWGIAHLPCYAGLINSALEAYTAGAEFSGGTMLREFAEYMLRRIYEHTTVLQDSFSKQPD
ncbi:MAG: DUF4111 domain-containing protein [Clostridiales bacterium]|nr:DUF4111 domain-containing protein [Clostridiales bacterium]